MRWQQHVFREKKIKNALFAGSLKKVMLGINYGNMFNVKEINVNKAYIIFSLAALLVLVGCNKKETSTEQTTTTETTVTESTDASEPTTTTEESTEKTTEEKAS